MQKTRDEGRFSASKASNNPHWVNKLQFDHKVDSNILRRYATSGSLKLLNLVSRTVTSVWRVHLHSLKIVIGEQY